MRAACDERGRIVRKCRQFLLSSTDGATESTGALGKAIILLRLSGSYGSGAKTKSQVRKPVANSALILYAACGMHSRHILRTVIGHSGGLRSVIWPAHKKARLVSFLAVRVYILRRSPSPPLPPLSYVGRA